ncbi:hypothetical protein J2858_001379 [Neorhizobium galegae]|uniref:hypothetical protein n=1 Tax=Neorhizobium galegae TaxID=399 RepID=UPI001AE7939F|nr:hypothetical protein [Neorhizobium galegae]MBP2548486.1 hypothetical protein [Neorhizobium galegae]
MLLMLPAKLVSAELTASAKTQRPVLIPPICAARPQTSPASRRSLDQPRAERFLARKYPGFAGTLAIAALKAYMALIFLIVR